MEHDWRGGTVATMTGSGDSDEVLPLVRLVREKVAASGLSLRAFATARDAKYSTLRRYHDEKLKPLKQPPRAHVLQDLAEALRVSPAVVQRAADHSVKRDYRHDDRGDVRAASIADDDALLRAIEDDPTLLPEAKVALLSQVKLWKRVGPEVAGTLGAEQERAALRPFAEVAHATQTRTSRK